MKYFPFVVLLVLALALPACQPSAERSDKIGVVVTLLPQAEFVESIAGDMVDITVMVPPGASPHTYEPTPSQIMALSQAVMYAKVGSGVDFELGWMDKLLEVNQQMLIVDCSEDIEIKQATSGQEEHEGLDPHIWMSPLNAMSMVSTIYDGLVQVDPESTAFYQQSRDSYLRELAQLDQDIREGLADFQGHTFMVYHPAFGYFAREYGLTIIPIEVEGKEPTPAGLARLIEQAEEDGIKVIFASQQFNPESAGVIAREIDGRVVLVDPLARDYIANMRLLLDELMGAMK
jgi:zinc transport system substrate-binding protein